MRIILFAMLLISQISAAETFDNLIDLMEAGKHDQVQAEIRSLYQAKEVVASSDVIMLYALESDWMIQKEVDDFISLSEKYLRDKNDEGLDAIKASFEKIEILSLKERKASVPESIEKLTAKKLLESKNRMSLISNIVAENNAKLKQIEDRRIASNKEAAQIKYELEKAETNKLLAYEKLKNENIKNKRKEDRESIDKAAKNDGLKGLYPAGIASFLYGVKHGKSLEDGLGFVFWSDYSVKSRQLDNKFEGLQLLNGMIIYSLLDYSGNERIDFTIMVPNSSKSMFLSGQRLRGSCHVFIGNGEYETIMGVKKTVPIFEPTSDRVCDIDKKN